MSAASYCERLAWWLSLKSVCLLCIAMAAAFTRAAMDAAAKALREQQAQAAASTWAAAAESRSATAAAAPSSAIVVDQADRVEFQQLLDLVAKCNGQANDPALERLMPHVKAWLRGHDELAPMGVELLLTRMRDTSALVRINLVRVADVLFLRSKAFRTALLERMHLFLLLAVGIGPGAEQHVPRPPMKARELQAFSVACIRQWDDTFGGHIQLLRLACDFIQTRVGNIHVAGASQLESEHTAAMRVGAQRQRTQRLLAVRFARLSCEFEAQESELRHLLQEVDNALQMLFPTAAGDKQLLSSYMLQASEQRDALKEEDDEEDTDSEPAAKRVKTEAQDPAPSLSSAAVDAPPEAAPSDAADVEWEEDAAAPPQASSLPATVAAAPALPASPPPPPLEGAAAVFGEFKAADASWWLDEQSRTEELDASYQVEDEGAQGEADGVGDDYAGDDSEHAAAAAATAGPELDRHYSLSIEFDAAALAGGAAETEANALLFQSLRDAWARIGKTFLPTLLEWIDTLTRIEFAPPPPNGDQAAATADAGTIATRLAALRRQRASYLQRANHARDRIMSLRDKCSRLGVHVSSLPSERSEVVRRETEQAISRDEAAISAAAASERDAARGLRAGTSAAANRADAAALDVATRTRQAAEIIRARDAAGRRAVKRIRQVKRKHAKEQAEERKAHHHEPWVDPLRRSFSSAPGAAAGGPAVASKLQTEGEQL